MTTAAAQKCVLLRAAGDSGLWSDVRAAAEELEGPPGFGEVLRLRRKRRVIRVTLPDGGTVVAKLWLRRRFPVVAYQVGYRWTTAYREWRIPNLLERSGVQASHATAYFAFTTASGHFGDMVLMKDFGNVRTLAAEVHKRLMCGDESGMEGLEVQLVEYLKKFLSAGFIDADGGILNFRMVPDQRNTLCPVRMDFEHCTKLPSRIAKLAARPYGSMLAKLVSSYTFLVQPRLDLANRFAERLVVELGPPARVVRRARRVLVGDLERQRQRVGLGADVQFP